MLVAAAASLAFAACASGVLTQVGTLSLWVGGSQPVVELAAAGGTMLASAPGSGFVAGQGALDVFTEPAGGWTSGSPSAVLTDPAAAHGPFGPSISGRTVVANYAPVTGASVDDVFVEPAGGWSGTVQPAARLVAPSGWNLDEGTISGDTIVAAAVNPQGTSAVLYVFVEPAGGWSGTVMPAATLTDSDGLSLEGRPAIAGATVFARTRSASSPVGRGDVFTEPAGGWSGTVHQSATLVSPLFFGPVAAGDLVEAGTSVFREPASGWHGAVKPAAGVYQAAAPGGGTGGSVVFSGATVATSSNSLGPEHGCPCGSAVWLFSEPARGWSGTRVATPVAGGTTETGYVGVALAGAYLFTTGGSSVAVYKLTGSFGSKVRPPMTTFPFASGLASGNARLSFTIKCATDGPPLTSLMLELPSGLSFTTEHARPTRAISIAGSHGYTLAIRNRALFVQLTRPARTLDLTVRARALVETETMIRHIRQLIKHARHKPIVILRADLHTTDITGAPTTTTIRFVADPSNH